jgi:hypothetical protein
MTKNEQFHDVVLILDDDLRELLARPRKSNASIRCLAKVIDYNLRLRARLAGQKVLVHHELLDAAAKLKLDSGAMGPIAHLVDLYGESAVDEPKVIELLQLWVSRCHAAL